MESLEVAPIALPVAARLELPGSKSHANRALVLAALAGNDLEIHRATAGEDVEAMVTGLRTLGYSVSWADLDAGRIRIESGRAEAASTEPAEPAVIDCGLAGTTLRFLCAVAAVTPGEWVVTGNERMQQRPIGPLIAALRQLGVDATDTAGCPPVHVRGAAAASLGGRVELDASVSSQFVTALCLIAPLLPSGMHVEFTGGVLASATYVDLTAATLQQFGARLERVADGLEVPPARLHRSEPLAIEADWSAAGPWLVLERLRGKRIDLPGLTADSTQGDRALPDVLDRMDEPSESLTIDVQDLPDQTMNLAVRAAFRTGPTEFVGAANLRVKECDRLAVTVAGLREFGVDAAETPDGLRVLGRPRAFRHASPPVAGDHRMAMAWAILGAAARGSLIEQPGCVAKSYPNFFEHLQQVREQPACLVVIGMRAAGKTTLANALGRELDRPVLDSDAELEQRIGPLADFVAAHGWPAFRAAESELLPSLLRPDHVLALGGGTLEDPRNATLVGRLGLVVHVDENPATLIERIRGSGRPRLGAGSLEDEVEATASRRAPTFESLADLQLPAGEDLPARIAAVRAWLQAGAESRRR